MRVAWIGPMPTDGGGAGGVSYQLLHELDTMGIEVDCYVPGHEINLPSQLKRLNYVRFICGPSMWEWNRWYSRNRLMSFITGQVANLRSENRLARLLVHNHQTNAYDVIYQFSHIEFSILRRFKAQLPPIVLHPSVHAQGELRFHRIEQRLSKASEPAYLRFGARILLIGRTFIQRRHIRYADVVLGLSHNFAEDLIRDYGVPSQKIRIVPNPINLERFAPSLELNTEKLTILFVSRIAVRKGVEMVVELSHRLDDLADLIEIVVMGDKSQWSDYTRLLCGLNPRTARYVGQVTGGDMVTILQSASILVQPSHYEPFGLTVGEALGCGVPVVASDKVGSAEYLDPSVCRNFQDGDIGDLEEKVRQLLREIEDRKTRALLAELARQECYRRYNGRVIAEQLVESLQDAVSVTAGTLSPRRMDIVSR